MEKNNKGIEKIFSVTMTETELKLFSKFLEERHYSDKKESKLTDEEEELVKQISYLPNREREKLKKQFETEEFLKGVAKEQIKERGSAKDVLGFTGGLLGAGAGFALGSQEGGIPIPYTNSYLGRWGGAALGHATAKAVGSGIGALKDHAEVKQVIRDYRDEPNNPRFKEITDEAEKSRNLIDVAEGKMNRSDFANKWHNTSDSKKKREF
jgi:hypothetical protein